MAASHRDSGRHRAAGPLHPSSALGRTLTAARAGWARFAAAAEPTILGDAFGQAAPLHFAWQTESPYVAARERQLVRGAFLPLRRRLLDVGCGEGATFAHLGEPAGAVGLELFEAKVQFARQRFPEMRFVRGSAEALPFEAASFDQVILRDLVHHLPEPESFVAEAHRVLAPGGRIDLLEPAAANPLIALHALSTPAERGELRSTERYLTGLLEPRFRVVRIRRIQALPVHRLLFHPELGRPGLATRPSVRALVDRVELWAERLLPRWCWAYIHVRAERRSISPDPEAGAAPRDR